MGSLKDFGFSSFLCLIFTFLLCSTLVLLSTLFYFVSTLVLLSELGTALCTFHI